MKTKNKLIITCLLFGLYLGSFVSQVSAQQETLIVDKGGKFHIDSTVRAGSVVLKPGMYQVLHKIEGPDNLIIFRVIHMGYRNNMGNERLGEEIARLKCTVESIEKKWKNTKLIVVRDASGQRVAQAIQIAGENVVHKI